jgi:hypothetical protein
MVAGRVGSYARSPTAGVAAKEAGGETVRIRTIKPEFWTSEDLAGLDDFTLLLAIGLLNYADDEGYFNAHPSLIRAALFPLRDECSTIPVAVTKLSNRGYVKLYRGSDGRTYGHVANFLKHQVINKPKKSKLKDLCVSEDGVLHLSGTDTVPVPSGTGNREQGKEQGTGIEGKAAGAAETVPETLALEPVTPKPTGPTAEAIYDAYPLKKARIDAIKAITSAMKRTTAARLLERTQAYAAAVALWSEADKRFIPHPATWFNRGSYDDDPKTWERNTMVNPHHRAEPSAADHLRDDGHGEGGWGRN